MSNTSNKKSLRLSSFKQLKEYINPSWAGRYSDEELFQKAMADVKEIKEFRDIPVKTKKIEVTNKKRDCTGDTVNILRSIVEGCTEIRLSDTGEYIEWVNKGIRRDLCDKLHKGNFAVQDYIDLHGMTLIEAEGEIAYFLKKAINKGYFCVKIIHGRGLRSSKGAVLKGAVEKWLQGRFRKYVIAYATARNKDGGLGATYVLLNRNP